MEELTMKERRWFYLSLTVLFSLLSLFIVVAIVGGAQFLNTIERAGYGENVISVSGEAEIFAVPDIATISFSIEVERGSVEEAQEEATKRVNSVIAFLEDQDVDEKDIKTTNYNAYPRYQYPEIQCIRFPCPTGERTLAGYVVNQTVSVKVRDTDAIGTILGGIGEREVSNINGPYFDIDNREELELQAKKEAIENAKEKAEELADSLGVRLGGIVSFNEGGYYPRAYSTLDFAAVEESIGGSTGKVAPEIPIGENAIRANVSIVYEIK